MLLESIVLANGAALAATQKQHPAGRQEVGSDEKSLEEPLESRALDRQHGYSPCSGLPPMNIIVFAERLIDWKYDGGYSSSLAVNLSHLVDDFTPMIKKEDDRQDGNTRQPSSAGAYRDFRGARRPRVDEDEVQPQRDMRTWQIHLHLENPGMSSQSEPAAKSSIWRQMLARQRDFPVEGNN